MSEQLPVQKFERVADQTLVALCDALDALDDDRLDAELASGVLSVEIQGAGKIVINSHRAALQIWMAAGAKAWHFDWDGARWIAQKDGAELWATAEDKVGQALGAAIRLQQP